MVVKDARFIHLFDSYWSKVTRQIFLWGWRQHHVRSTSKL